MASDSSVRRCLRLTGKRRTPEAEAAAVVTEVADAAAAATAAEATTTEAAAAATEATTTEAAAMEAEAVTAAAAEVETAAAEEEVAAAAVTEAAQAQVQAAVATEPPPSSLQPPSSIYTSPRTNYEVFLSFRGPDTRKEFADYLYTSLINARIIVFRDNNELDPGENVPDALVKSIKQSKISIPILSQGYASSKSCLMELAQMVECQEADARLIVPIFYDIKPADLKYRRGCVGEAFLKHEKRGVDREVINKWQQALGKIADVEGYDLQNTNMGYGALTGEVVSDILKRLEKNDLYVTGGLVGM